jgi:hypothetical protein
VTDWSASGVLSVSAAAFIALVFAKAALHKLDDPERFRAALEAYRLAPQSIAAKASSLIAPLELAAAAMIVTPWTFGPGAGLMAALLLAYGVAIAVNLARGRTDIDCGCGDKPEPLSWLLVGRNLILAALALLAAIAGPAQAAAEITVALALAVTVFLLWIAGGQAVQNHTHWRGQRAAAATFVFGSSP